MKRIGILGHYGFGSDESNGQTIKTKIITKELQGIFGEDEISMADTKGGWKFALRMPFVIFWLLARHRNVIIFPASGASKILPIVLVAENVLFHRSLHHVAIGSQLPKWVRQKSLLRFCLRRFKGIYVETRFMKEAFDEMGFTNVFIMPNSKRLPILTNEELKPRATFPLRLCTFSRVMEEKGIEDAINAVKNCNRQLGQTMFLLDIYGQIEQPEWFETLMKGQPSEIHYGGIVPFADSTNVLRNYFALVFPTRYKIEGFAGTLIDAMTAGLPTIASDCRSNIEILEEGKTGIIYPIGDVEALTRILVEAANHPESIEGMRQYCIIKAKEFQPNKVVKVLADKL